MTGRGASAIARSGGQQQARRLTTAMPTRVRQRTPGAAPVPATYSRGRTHVHVGLTRSALGVLLLVSCSPLVMLHGGAPGGGICGTMPFLAGAAAEGMSAESGAAADPVEEIASQDTTTTDSSDTIADEAVTREEPEQDTSTSMSSEEAEPSTVHVNEASKSTSIPQSSHPSDNETASAKKKGVAFGGFAGTAAAPPGTEGRNTNTSTTSHQNSGSGGDIVPPDGFVLASRIVSVDGLSYFVDSAEDNMVDSELSVLGPSPVLGDLTIPFLDCGAVGSFTDAMSMRDCSFRHLPSGAEPFGWSTVDTPQIMVALQPLEVTVSGGGGDDGLEATRRNFRAGDVLLFEDTEGKGHKMKAAPVKKKGATGGKPAPTPSLHPDMSVLIISLPKRHANHHRAGTGTGASSGSGGDSEDKTAIRLPALFGKRKNHNKENDTANGDPPRPCLVETDGTYSSLGPPASQTLSDVLPSPGRIIRGAVGAVLSALATDRWLGRGQPRVSGWLGGCALVVGGTCGFAAVGEGTLESLADWWEEFVINRRWNGNENDKDSDDMDLEGLKEEIKEEILPTLFAGRNSSEKL